MESQINNRPLSASDLVSKVRVVVRVRPFLPHETKQSSCISVVGGDSETGEEVTVHLKDFDTSRNECYQLDSFFGQEDGNLCQIFEREVNPLIPGIFHGFNATVFAYGATGSGKTYTMQGTELLPGLMLLAMSKILYLCQKTGSTAEISYYEVYMDRCYDLLELKEREILILDDEEGQTHLRGLSRVPISSISEFQEILSLGCQRRKIAHTGLNDVSSRSHGVLVISVSTPCVGGSENVVIGKLNLIDLAGNEDNRKTGNEGIRIKESAKINQSLFALSNVICALNNNKPRVPYRESKLTRILQDSLGGTSRALMVACLNPGEYQESVHTVSLAARSRHIKNFISSAQKQETPRVKVDMRAKLRAWLESKGKTKSIQRVGACGTPFPTSSVKKLNYHSSAKAKIDTNRSASTVKRRELKVPFMNLLSEEDVADSCFQVMPGASTDNGEKISIDSAQSASDENTNLAADASEMVGQVSCIDSNDLAGESPMKNVLQSPLRKALSPVNSNVKHTPRDVTTKKLEVLFEPENPETPSIVCANDDKQMETKTPLDKFNTVSSTLKNSLVQQYIDFLNTASREELMEIKGIGVKMADYIVEIRETSPLKSLSDLEKTGLSSKQVYNMFNRAAKGIF